MIEIVCCPRNTVGKQRMESNDKSAPLGLAGCSIMDMLVEHGQSGVVDFAYFCLSSSGVL